jgi:hypothetical protein
VRCTLPNVVYQTQCVRKNTNVPFLPTRRCIEKNYSEIWEKDQFRMWPPAGKIEGRLSQKQNDSFRAGATRS